MNDLGICVCSVKYAYFHGFTLCLKILLCSYELYALFEVILASPLTILNTDHTHTANNMK